MATIDVKDAANQTVAIEKPLAPGRAAAAASRPVVLSTEDLASLAAIVAAIGALPAGGDASAANQETAIAGLASILAKLSADPATQTTLAAVLAKMIVAPATEAKQDTLIAKDFATQTTLAALLAKVIAAPATEAKQDTMIARAVAALGARTVAQSPAINIATDDPQIGTKVTAVTALGAGGAGLIGWLSQIWDRIGSIGTRTYSTVERVGVASTAAQSAAITGTEVLLHASTRCYVLAGSGTPAPSATTGIPLEAGEKFHMRITSGHKIGVIRDSADGFLHVVTVA